MAQELEMKDTVHVPTDEAREEARLNPGGWVYKIEGNFGREDAVPREAVVGAWQVDENGYIIGEFIPNPNFRRPKSSETTS
jgi:hypothetical protein